MTKFQEEIKGMARERKKRPQQEEPITAVEIIYEASEAIDGLYRLAKVGVMAYNEGSDENALFIYELPEELLILFFNLPGKRIGFCIKGPERFVVFLDEPPSDVLVLGQKRQTIGVIGQVLTRARQLIKITCLRSGNGFIFKDNTGAALNPEDIIKHIIKWVSE
jgi:hypothetical protein